MRILYYFFTLFLGLVFISCKKPPLETPSVADAGPDQTIMKPRDNTSLSGELSLGRIVSYKWTTVAGPNSPNMDMDRILSMPLRPYEMLVSNLEEGVYQFELMVTDNGGATARDTMKVTVLPDSLTRDPSRMIRYDNLWWEDSCAIRISNISSAIPATGSIQVFMASYYGGGVFSSGWYQIQAVRSSGYWYEIRNDVLIIHAAAYTCGGDDFFNYDYPVYDVLIKWN